MLPKIYHILMTVELAIDFCSVALYRQSSGHKVRQVCVFSTSFLILLFLNSFQCSLKPNPSQMTTFKYRAASGNGNKYFSAALKVTWMFWEDPCKVLYWVTRIFTVLDLWSLGMDGLHVTAAVHNPTTTPAPPLVSCQKYKTKSWQMKY